MPRRRPRVLRAQRVPRQVYADTGSWGVGLPKRWRPSRRIVSAIRREEYRSSFGEGWWPGAALEAIDAYRAFLARPGKYLYLLLSISGSQDQELRENVAVARDLLEVVVHRLPTRARRDLEALLAEMDDELRRRTLPDPLAYRQPYRRGGWWHWRIYDETHHL